VSNVDLQVRRELREGDAEALVELHTRLYSAQYGMDARFTDGVRSSIAAALDAGWMRDGGAVWLLDSPALAGSLALTDEGGGLGRVRWFVLAPELRGRGLGRSLIGELLAEARRLRLTKLELVTFSALTAAARIYRDAGFELMSSEQTDMWGPLIVLQRYELTLDPSESPDEHDRAGDL
jgi:GNAT superfamily N-acetyltransferase